jgi:hypothetical protein
MSGLPAEAISAGLCRSVFGKVREEGYQGRSPWLVSCVVTADRIDAVDIVPKVGDVIGVGPAG